MISVLRIDCREFVRQRSEEEWEWDTQAAHIRCCDVTARMKWPRKKEGTKKNTGEAGANGERLKCNEVRSKKNDLIYLQKNTGCTEATRRAEDEITEGPEYEISGETENQVRMCDTMNPLICNQLNLPPTQIHKII